MGVGYRRVKPPRAAELERLIHQISERVGRHLQRQGLLVRDMGYGEPTEQTTADICCGATRVDPSWTRIR